MRHQQPRLDAKAAAEQVKHWIAFPNLALLEKVHAFGFLALGILPDEFSICPLQCVVLAVFGRFGHRSGHDGPAHESTQGGRRKVTRGQRLSFWRDSSGHHGEVLESVGN